MEVLAIHFYVSLLVLDEKKGAAAARRRKILMAFLGL
jgi:hypothetical protein